MSTISCPKCPTVENHNLIISGTQDEICRAARLGTLHGWCHTHDTMLVPKEVQARIAANCDRS
jgi:hypothetical protein